MATKIFYNGELLSELTSGYSATLECAEQTMDGNVVIEVSADQGGNAPKPVNIPYITFSSPSAFTIQATRYEEDMLGGGDLDFGGWGSMVDTPEKNWDGIIEYSTDTTTWTEWDGVTEISSIDGKLYLRGTGNTIITGSCFGAGWGTYRLKIAGENVSCSGNLENLLDYTVTSNDQHPEVGMECFYGMFYECEALISAPDILSEAFDQETASYACAEMFGYCPNLVTPPRLSVTTLSDYCYENMFSGCTSLASVPELPAIELPDGCYNYMFGGCEQIILSAEQTDECQYEYRIPSVGTGILAPSDPENTEYFSFASGMFSSEIEVAVNTTYYLNVPVHSATPPAAPDNTGSIKTCDIKFVVDATPTNFSDTINFSGLYHTTYENGITTSEYIENPCGQDTIQGEIKEFWLRNVVVGSYITMNLYAAPSGHDITLDPPEAMESLWDDLTWIPRIEGTITCTITPYEELFGGGE